MERAVSSAKEMLAALHLPSGFVATPTTLRAPTHRQAPSMMLAPEAWVPTVAIAGVAAVQMTFKQCGIFVSKDQAPSGIYQKEKEMLARTGWLQSALGSDLHGEPLPSLEELLAWDAELPSASRLR